MDSAVQWFANNMPSFLSPEAAIFLVSMVPILELRGGLLLASILKIPMVQASVICIIGNILPIPFILLFIRQIFKWLKKTKIFRPLIEKLEKRAMGKSDKIKKFEFWGLVLFVGVPLPGTGGWTGALIASLLEVDLKKSVPAILLGICMATVIMLIVSYGMLGTIMQ
ncbi:small multi-drug export protein [Lactonifactor longoviformis]|uniref:Uncharacterized membrane protein n=1 Tax=Lactonifactor longoviformis DSM 17459 TaxID=1122155 RepID=A0A1M4Z7B3_9CLOT|nr:small multi-drug export protein [Lactonifactor longoviformis]POP33268.1 small multi-drug export protein [Lactonifactor longoviformis]SHF13885.1 Uncharacterized membrane protein [Lactonifactor longoviformis DSM 17459]